MKTRPSLFRIILILSFLGGAFPCPADPYWTWIRGDKMQHASGVYGTQGRPGAENRPGVRYGAAAWTDQDGRLWLFGGYGRDTSGAAGFLSDLWRFDSASGQWTWIKGVKRVNQHGAYDDPGVATPGSMPGARTRAACWTDGAGRLWLFGGAGRDGAGAWSWLSDLWRYDVAAGEWAWIKGSDRVDQCGAYGTPGVPAAANAPGARQHAASWSDGAGRLWLFGGYGLDGAGASGRLSDLWRFDPAAGEWAWVKGARAVNQDGVYGAQGVADPANAPGARHKAAAWRDQSGRLWLFGGCAGPLDAGICLNDLWRFDPSTGEWTWVKGSSAVNQYGVYGTQGVEAASNAPGARGGAACWTDEAGRLWLCGGGGLGAVGAAGALVDLWRFDPSTTCWTWVRGGQSVNPPGVYGAPGLAAPASVPGARQGAVAWSGGWGRAWL